MDIRNFFKSKKSHGNEIKINQPVTTSSGIAAQTATTSGAAATSPNQDQGKKSKIVNEAVCDLGTLESGPAQPLLNSYPSDVFGKQNRSFSSNLFKDYSFLEYSVNKNAVFCFVCRHFNTKVTEDTFVKDGYNNWKKVKEKINKHQTCKSHLGSMSKWIEFQKTKKTGTIEMHFSSCFRDEVAKNREYMSTLFDITLCIARQGMSYRGHDESKTSTNKGNFKEVCELFSRHNDSFGNFFSRHISYTSKVIQNELIEILSGLVQGSILSEIQNCGIFAIMCDEARCFKEEQLAFCIRYANSLEIKERFVKFIDCSVERNAQALYELINATLQELNLNNLHLVGQAYDGAAVMSGCLGGLQTKIREKYPTAIFTHCMAHKLNLSLTDSCKVHQGVRNTFNTLEALYVHFSNPSNHKILLNIQKSLNIKAREISQLCETRWACRFKNLHAVENAYEAITNALEIEIMESRDRNTINAIGLLQNLKQGMFIVHLFVLENVLQVVHILSSSLQEKNLTLGKATLLVNSVFKTFEDMRNDSSFSTLWKDISEFAEKFDIVLEPASSSKRKKTLPSNLADFSPESTVGRIQESSTSLNAVEYWRANIYYKVLDSIIGSLKLRFSEESQELALAVDQFLNLHYEDSSYFIEIYSSTLNINKDSLKAEMIVAKNLINSDNADIDITLEQLQKSVNQSTFPNLYKLIQVAIILPVSSATCERSFSAMRRVKTWLRTSMLQNRFDSLSLLYIEKDIDVKLEDAVNIFSKKVGRKIAL